MDHERRFINIVYTYEDEITSRFSKRKNKWNRKIKKEAENNKETKISKLLIDLKYQKT